MIDTQTKHYELLATKRVQLNTPHQGNQHHDQELKIGNYKTLIGVDKAIHTLTTGRDHERLVSYVVYEVTEKVIRQETLIPQAAD